MRAERSVDVLIVGAGLHGLTMAKTYIEIHPQHRILVVDEAETVGGSWSKERLYPRLKTNNVLGSYELSDFPMVAGRYEGAKRGTHIPGSVVHQYLSDAAANYGIESSRVQLRTKVKTATLGEDGKWWVELHTTRCNDSGSESENVTVQETIVANKMIVATGLTSEPNVPVFPGQEDFGGMIIHSKQLKARATELRLCKNVVVLGGNKSAWDVCYDAARSGALVHMVIRPSGGGPSYVWPKTFKFGPWSFSLSSLSATRFFTAFDPSLLHARKGPVSRWSRFLHRTVLGNKLCRYFWSRLDRHIRRINGYDSHPELKKLEPWTTPFWMGNSLSIHNYESNWFDLVREGKIKVHISEIAFLSKGKVHLTDDDTTLEADALVCCTGWKSQSSIRFNETGLPSHYEDSKETQLDIQRAETEVAQQSRYLRKTTRRTANAPPLPLTFEDKKQKASLETCMYRDMVPIQPHQALGNRNVAFIGALASIHAVIVAQAQALWITAYFDGKLQSQSSGFNTPSHSPQQDKSEAESKARYDAILHTVYGKTRRPRECGGAADKHADLVFDSIPYIDSLLSDLGLRTRRKRWFWDELFSPYGPMDYKGIVEEWKNTRR